MQLGSNMNTVLVLETSNRIEGSVAMDPLQSNGLKEGKWMLKLLHKSPDFKDLCSVEATRAHVASVRALVFIVSMEGKNYKEIPLKVILLWQKRGLKGKIN